MSLLDRHDLDRILRRYSEDAVVRLGVRVGSQVYGTATPESDTDFIVVGEFRKDRDLLFGDDYNVTILSPAAFLKSLNSQSVYALEGLMAPSEHRLIEAGPTFPWKINRAKLGESSTEKSDSDWKKGIKLLESDPDKARRKLFHALRVLEFARQVVNQGKIEHFDSANDWFEEILTEPSNDPAQYNHWNQIRMVLRNQMEPR